jgi:hypothetical protein
VTAEGAEGGAVARAVLRGTSRLLARLGWSFLPEFPLADGSRADILALAEDGRVLIVEIKSSAADYRSDRKWAGYRDWCDLFAFAVPEDFPVELLPDDAGLLLADAWDAAIRRDFAPCGTLPGARRKALTARFARLAARRLHRLADPDGTPSTFS